MALRIKVHEAYEPKWSEQLLDDCIRGLWKKPVVKKVLKDDDKFPQVDWFLFDDDDNLITIVSLSQDSVWAMKPGNYYSKSLTSWVNASRGNDRYDKLGKTLDAVGIYTYVPKDGYQPKRDNPALELSEKKKQGYRQGHVYPADVGD